MTMPASITRLSPRLWGRGGHKKVRSCSTRSQNSHKCSSEYTSTRVHKYDKYNPGYTVSVRRIRLNVSVQLTLIITGESRTDLYLHEGIHTA